ncbi:Uncharacterised protein [Vibrio cholerae]|uniref:Uncharacterized protein n=1 Tax=Vibrio cholerae TaxID=666 RepID=A0A655Z9A9_VIBCL|nr:Uncharacterised protein [Vibrio cholerae]
MLRLTFRMNRCPCGIARNGVSTIAQRIGQTRVTLRFVSLNRIYRRGTLNGFSRFNRWLHQATT